MNLSLKQLIFHLLGTTGTYTKPPNGELSTVDDDLLYTPDAGFCGSDMFSYTLTDATGEYSDSAVVTIEVICAPAPTPSPETVVSPYPTYFTGDEDIFSLNHYCPDHNSQLILLIFRR